MYIIFHNSYAGRSKPHHSDKNVFEQRGGKTHQRHTVDGQNIQTLFFAKATLCGRWPQPAVYIPRLNSEETAGNCSVHDGGGETFKMSSVHTEVSSHWDISHWDFFTLRFAHKEMVSHFFQKLILIKRRLVVTGCFNKFVTNMLIVSIKGYLSMMCVLGS